MKKSSPVSVNLLIQWPTCSWSESIKMNKSRDSRKSFCDGHSEVSETSLSQNGWPRRKNFNNF